MLSNNILFSLVKNMSVIVTFAYILSKVYTFDHIINKQTRRWKLYLILFCIPLSIAGTYLSIEILGALANIRSIGAIVAGIYGGPVVGILVGLISGFHRWTLGGFTAVACAVGAVSSGMIGGLYKLYQKEEEPTTEGAMLITGVALLIEMLIIVLISKPGYQAIDLVKIIILPMTLSNVLGVGIFVNILENAREELDHIKALQAKKALTIANQTLPYLRKGLDHQSAKKVVEIIYNETDLDAVAITGRDQIMAFVGKGADHHQAKSESLTRVTRQSIREGEMAVVLNKDEIGCPDEECPLKSAVVVPLLCNDEVIGVLKMYRTRCRSMSPSDIELARGIGSLLYNQMEIARLSEQAQLSVEAELKALQHQINPHFLFNAINTIVSYCRTQPMVARKLLLKLSKVFRYTLKSEGYFCTLEEELKLIEDYMSIEEARFGERVQLTINIPDNLDSIKIPRLSLQPLVENAVKHGLSAVTENGQIEIMAQRNNKGVRITVKDNGIGISEKDIVEVIKVGQGKNTGIGLSNVNQRLINLFGQDAGIKLDSQVGLGTSVTFTVPEEVEYQSA